MTPELFIDKPIDAYADGIDATQFIAQLSALGNVPKVIVRINSPGGDAFAGMSIYNALVRNPAKVEVSIDGLCASIASVIAMAADDIHIAENGMMMVHLATGFVYGPAATMRSTAATLEKIDGTIASVYAARTNMSAQYWLAKMRDETYFNAQEAKAAKLVDEIKPNKTAPKFAASTLGRYLSRRDRIAALAGPSEQSNAARYRADHRRVLAARLYVEKNPYKRRALEVQLAELT